MLNRAKEQLLQTDPEQPVERGRAPKRRRRYTYHPRFERVKRIVYRSVTAALCGILAVSAWNLISYGAAYLASVHGSNELREMYYADHGEEGASVPEAAATAVPTRPSVTASPTAAPQLKATLPPGTYPDNPHLLMSSRFSRIRRQNEDIIGWLRIEGLVDEAVVQRDNEYYLNRDYKGYHNENGAIFLDEAIHLRTRPYTLMLYGHNMKTGRMFGGLRNYENLTYYRNNPFVTFDTVYEDGQYVIFAVCTISTDVKHWRYVNWAQMTSPVVENREKAISSLFRFSEYSKAIDVQADDQILLLFTCVDEQADRRVIAARRIREDETEAELLKDAQKTRRK